MYIKTFASATLAALFLMTLDSSVKAEPISFDFSFTGTASGVNSSNGDLEIPGTVSGEIIDLNDNSTSNPSDIVITSLPDGIVLPDNSLASLGWDLTAGAGFTVTNGVITNSNYQATGLVSDSFGDSYSATLNFFGNGDLNAVEVGNPTFVADLTGNGVTFTAVSAPEPSQLALLPIAALSLFAWKRFKKASV